MNVTEAKRLSQEFVDRVCELPNGEKILECIQCGTCSASCPTADAMEYSPREIIAALRAGMLDRALRSNTVWFCVSCYSCTVRCPAGIPFTDVMYELKRLGAERGITHKDANAAAMAKAFVKTVNRHGRNAEVELIRDYYLSTNLFNAFGQIPLAMQLMTHGRLGLKAHKIKGLKGLRKMMAVVEEGESK
jgi:heterodisulfide reductase subunit C